ncbi:MAG: hypothetical protein LCH20_05200 [Proteobacteria bacterium]|nr:hypothetical protein [Pseudomonadota bacterium]
MSDAFPYLEKATHALAELNSVHKTIPNTALFIYMYVRKEALLSSQIEGTQSSFSDLMLFEHNQKPEAPTSSDSSPSCQRIANDSANSKKCIK